MLKRKTSCREEWRGRNATSPRCCKLRVQSVEEDQERHISLSAKLRTIHSELVRESDQMQQSCDRGPVPPARY
jgi:hypothetical protein